MRAISQEELAQLSGLHRTYISDLERGRRNVALENIEKIANALGQDIKELFNFDQEWKLKVRLLEVLSIIEKKSF